MSPICLSAEAVCWGVGGTITTTQVEARPQEGQIKGAVQLTSNTPDDLSILLLPLHLISSLMC